MRVRPKRQADPRRTLIPRRGFLEPAHERAAADATAGADTTRAAADPADHPHEERMRASGGPEDNALYRCVCGFAFEAAVSTTVSCPHCGTGQAW
jgi:rubrerythrin